MSGFKQITNAGGAFGYGEQSDRDARGPQVIRRFHNMSSVNAIQKGSAVIFSSLSTDGTGVVVTTVAGSPRFAGVALTSATTGQSTHLTSLAPAAAWCSVVVEGPVYAMLDTVTVNGDIIGITNTTAASGAANGGLLGPIVSTQVAGNFFGIAGFAHTSGSTLAPDGVTTQIPRGYVTLRPCIIPGSTL